jgi:plastocyanin domain-containing protein
MNLARLAALPLAAVIAAAVMPAAASAKTKPQVVKLAVTQDGFAPEKVTVKSGQPVKLVVTRQVERSCATEIVMKDFGVNQPLPLGKAVEVTITPKKAGAYRYACGMDMIAGTLEAR